MTDYKLVLAFDTNDPEFTRGFECGQVWSAMEHMKKACKSLEEINEKLGHDVYVPSEFISIRTTVHVSNTEMVMRMCEAEDFVFCAEPFGEDWMTVILTPRDFAEKDENDE